MSRCRRLIKNAIICWNYLYLSQKIAQEEDIKHRQELLAAVQNGSVVSWRHINLHGAPGSARGESSHEGTLLGVNRVARGIGTLIRGRRVSEAPSTMWLRSGLPL
jgi:hypothetical protein